MLLGSSFKLCIYFQHVNRWLLQIETIEGRLRDAVKVYIQMGVYNMKPDLVTYTVLIKGVSELGRLDDALVFLFQSIKNGFLSDVVTYCTLIDGCCKQKHVLAGLWIFEMMRISGVNPDIAIYNVLIN
ncbi:hypothetical protein C1H46_027279 [Malus baccata]|uniref:Pentacotripeptide-repeat region of PRORP domain-containing protein n=1 Tax=Malus baccata TaxID=106549 RepID=A0A540LLD5_MALBA|nr:hypothetical protein C1H46_027279 [Malus baccata]